VPKQQEVRKVYSDMQKLQSKGASSGVAEAPLPGISIMVEAPRQKNSIEYGAMAPSSTAARVLVVDDDPQERRDLARIVSSLGYFPEIACDGEEALEKLAAEKYSIVFCDLHMAGLPPLELTRRVRATLRKQPHIIAMSASCEPEDRAATVEAGMCCFLLKPLTKSSLRSALHPQKLSECRVCSSHQGTGEASRENPIQELCMATIV